MITCAQKKYFSQVITNKNRLKKIFIKRRYFHRQFDWNFES